MTLHNISISFQNKLKKVQSENSGLSQCAFKSIQLCRNSLLKLRKEVVSKGFSDTQEEIHFFKSIKQVPLVPLIYYSEIQNFLCYSNENSLISKQKIIRKHLNTYDDFYLRNLDFGQYVEMSSTHFDDYYYTRKSVNSLPVASSRYYLQDTEFNTPRDFLLAQFKAYGLMITFLRKRQLQLDKEQGDFKLKGHFDLKCTTSKIDIVELIYALSASKAVIGDIKELVRAFETILNIELGDFYRTFVDIRSRNNDPSKFLDALKIALLRRIEELDN